MVTRRRLLKAAAISGLAAWFHIDVFRGPLQAQADAAGGEPYSGFLLLPSGAPIPAAVTPPKYGVPIVCGVGGDLLATASGAETVVVSKQFGTHHETARFSGIPLYTLNSLPSKIQPLSGAALGYEWGVIATTTLNFQSYDTQAGTWKPGLSIWAQTQFPRPFPIWYPESGSLDATGWPEKVGFLPAPGLRIASGVGPAGKRLGYTFYWIMQDVLYWLIVEDYSSRDEAQALASTLAPLT
jgi:hypothetical protein